MKNTIRKMLAVVTATAVMAVTVLAGTGQKASAEVDLDTMGTYEGSGQYISTVEKDDYFDKGSMLEVTFRYDYIDTVSCHLNFNDTLDYWVYGNAWDGWEKTKVGPNGYDKTISVPLPSIGDTYTVRVPFSVIEAKYKGTNKVRGINLATGSEIGDTKITILSHRIVGDVQKEGAEFTATGSWAKGEGGTMELTDDSVGSASFFSYDGFHNLIVSQFSIHGFINPTVDVTVEYGNEVEDNRTVQAEIKIDDQPIHANYTRIRHAGKMTYTTELPEDITSFMLCYDNCTITKIHVYDNTEPEREEISGKTGEEINERLNPCWNLGNALECVVGGEVEENIYSNPTQVLFQKVKAAGFESIRIPVSYFNKVDSNGNIDEEYLAKVRNVVSKAINSGLYVIIDIHHDGSDGVNGKWLDISKTGSAFTAIKTKFTRMWQQIAYAFSDYDQHLVFESMSEVMISGSYDKAPAQAYQNINELNQAFVNAVRSAGGNSLERCLIIPGYNTDINLTAANYGTKNGFQVPIDSTPNKLILMVNFFDPYQFTLDTSASGTTSCTTAELRAIGTQFDKIINATELPVFIGEYGAMDKSNTYDRADYLDRVRREADRRGISIAYWDNRYYVEGGSALFDRQSNEITEDGEILLSAIMGTYDN